MNELYIWGGLIAAALIIGWWAWPKKEKVAEEVKTEPAPSAPVVAAVNDQITDAVTQTAPVKKPRAKKPVAPKTTAAKAKKAPAKKAKKK